MWIGIQTHNSPFLSSICNLFTFRCLYFIFFWENKSFKQNSQKLSVLSLFLSVSLWLTHSLSLSHFCPLSPSCLPPSLPLISFSLSPVSLFPCLSPSYLLSSLSSLSPFSLSSTVSPFSFLFLSLTFLSHALLFPLSPLSHQSHPPSTSSFFSSLSLSLPSLACTTYMWKLLFLQTPGENLFTCLSFFTKTVFFFFQKSRKTSFFSKIPLVA